MGLGSTVGHDLLDVPFPQMVLQLALAIADGQAALDRTSINTAKLLGNTQFNVLTEIVDVITPKPGTANPGGIAYTGAQVASTFNFEDMSLLQAGLFPTFYQFTESIIEVKMAISAKTSSEFSLDVKAEGGFCFFSASVEAKYSQSYSYSVDGSSLLRTTLKPVPPPARLVPRTVTVDALVQPPRVTIA
jgi:hypothetical protein